MSNPEPTEFTKKIRERWKPFEEHRDTTIDYILSDLYKASGIIDRLTAELKAKDKALLEIKVNSYPGLAAKESTMLNKIYRCATQALKGKQ